MKEFILQYIQHLETEASVSLNTIAAYQGDIFHFQQFIESPTVASWADVTPDLCAEYLAVLHKNNRAPATILRNMASLRRFFQYLTDKKGIPSNPALRLSLPKEEKRFPAILPLEKVELLLAQPRGEGAKEVRDKAMLELLYATGIRVSEIIALQTDDIKLPQARIICHSSRTVRTIPLGTAAVAALVHYFMQARQQLVGNKDEQTVFVNCTGNPMTRQGFWKIVKQYAKKAGISDRITPQTLRNSFAAHMIENGADIQSVSELLGHSDISSTLLYQQLKQNKLKKVYEQAHPRS